MTAACVSGWPARNRPTKFSPSVALIRRSRRDRAAIMEMFQTILGRKLSDALAAAGLPNAGELTPARDARFGDYQTNAALVLAKQRGENPRAIAEKIVAHFDADDLCEPP